MDLHSGQALQLLWMQALRGGEIFDILKNKLSTKSQTRVLAFLNIVGNGMVGRFEEQDTN